MAPPTPSAVNAASRIVAGTITTRTMVESIMAYSLSASWARCSKTAFQTPRTAHRLNRVCTMRKSPKLSRSFAWMSSVTPPAAVLTIRSLLVAGSS